jgi:hypothetical protein
MTFFRQHVLRHTVLSQPRRPLLSCAHIPIGWYQNSSSTTVPRLRVAFTWTIVGVEWIKKNTHYEAAVGGLHEVSEVGRSVKC